MPAMVVIPTSGSGKRRVYGEKVIDISSRPYTRLLMNPTLQVHRIVSNRVIGQVSYTFLSCRSLGPCMADMILPFQEEQFLVQWKTELKTGAPPLSWHAIDELARCLDPVQDYLDIRAK